MAPIPKSLFELLETLKYFPSDDLHKMISRLDSKNVDLLCALVHNVVFNTMKIPPSEMKKLKRRMSKNKEEWQLVVNRGITPTKRRNILVKQCGNGLMSLILTLVAPLILGLTKST